jgi:hypothetical protein
LAAVARPSTSLNLRSGFFGHGRESFLDGFKWNADKVGDTADENRSKS